MNLPLLILTFFLFFTIESSVKAQLPLWEGGVAALMFRADHYRGSDQQKYYFIPAPYFTYRGGKVHAENAMVRGSFYSSERLFFDMSFNVGLNVNSQDNRKREGMTDIHPSFEVGPMMRYLLWKDENASNRLLFEWPYRAVTATNIKSFQHVGFFSIPYLNFISKPQPWLFNWSSEFSIGPMYGSAKYHDYYYGVSQNYERQDRPVYSAREGYSGTQLSWIISKRFKDVILIPFVRYDYLNHAAFDDSPLFVRKHYWLFGTGLVWYFYKSSEKQSGGVAVK